MKTREAFVENPGMNPVNPEVILKKKISERILGTISENLLEGNPRAISEAFWKGTKKKLLRNYENIIPK